MRIACGTGVRPARKLRRVIARNTISGIPTICTFTLEPRQVLAPTRNPHRRTRSSTPKLHPISNDFTLHSHSFCQLILNSHLYLIPKPNDQRTLNPLPRHKDDRGSLQLLTSSTNPDQTRAKKVKKEQIRPRPTVPPPQASTNVLLLVTLLRKLGANFLS